MSTSHLSTRLRLLAAFTCLSLVAVACGDDDDEAATADETTTTAADGEAAGAETDEYCALVEEMDSGDGPPTNEQLEEIKELAPEAVAEDTEFVADAFIEADGDFGKVFSDPEVEAALGRLEEHDAEVCGFETPENEEDEPETEPIEGAQVVPVTAVDFAFEGLPAEIPAGPTSFEFTNDGEAAHEMAVFKLGEGVDLDALLASEEEPSEEDAQEVGFTFAPPGEGGVYLNADDLQPGTYAVVCFIPGPEGKPHYELGMKTTFTVA